MAAKIKDESDLIDAAALEAALTKIGAQGGSGPQKRKDVLALLKDALSQGTDEARRRFESHGRGDLAVRDNCRLLDLIIARLYAYACAYENGGSDPDEMAVIAVGGYGRGELAPKSDLDLLFLTKPKRSGGSEKLIEYMLYFLWDMGLKVGQSTRSVAECVKQAKADMTIRTALLERRLIAGDAVLFHELGRRYRSDVVAGTEVAFVEAKLEERDQRHARQGEARYVLEPNIKEGKGGLRDLHSLCWIAEYLFDIREFGELKAKGVISADAARRFNKAQDFLWTVRCHLHYLTDREEDRLTFDVQREISWRMGYADRAGVEGVERFMKHYFLIAKDVGDLTRIFCARLEAENKRKSRSLFPIFQRSRTVDGFTLKDGRLDAPSENAFAEDPVRMVRLFHTALSHSLDIHPRALSLITQNLRLIDNRLRNDPEANRLFLDILTSRKDPESALRHMNEAGVLGQFIPDFGRVVAQMQYDMYHVYTVDEHTIQAIGILNRLETGVLKEDHPLVSEIMTEIDPSSRRTLYVAVLLHDIAKGRGGDHSELGAEIALKLGPRFGLSAAETEMASWLVRWHLLMTRTVFKRDIEDEQTVADFTAQVQSPERLKLLLALTVADVRAVGPSVWNAWKGGLLRALYHLSFDVLTGGGLSAPYARRVLEAQGELRKKLAGIWSADEIESYMALGSPGYWASHDPNAFYRHALLVKKAEKANSELTVDLSNSAEKGVTEVTVYAKDTPGLFSRIAGGMALGGASIVDAKIATFANGMALDVFSILNAEGEPFDPRRDGVERLLDAIEQTVSGQVAPPREIEKRREAGLARARMFVVEPRVLVNNSLSSTHTVIEINARNRIGLLYDATAMMTGLSLSIASAHISTYGERAVDVFYVKDSFGMKVTNERKIAEIREKLLSVLIDPQGVEQKAKRPRKKISSAAKSAAR